MRVRHVMNKHGVSLEQSDQAATPSAPSSENNAGMHIHAVGYLGRILIRRAELQA